MGNSRVIIGNLFLGRGELIHAAYENEYCNS